MKFSKKLEYMRKKRNISQTQVAKKLGVSRQTVYKWEADINKPEFDKIEKLAELFEISYNLLLDDSIDLPKYFGDDLSTEEHLPERDILDENISMENKIIDKRLPFILGIIAIIVLALIAISVGFIVNFVSNDGNDTSTKADTTIDTAIILEITFNAGEGELIGEKNASIAYGSVMNNIPTATKSKYVFLGWYDENDVKLDATTKHYQNKIYTAKYAEKTVTVYFNPGEGTVSEQERTVPIGTKIGELPIPVREGYAFVCWRANKRIINSDTIIDIDVVVNAVWSDQNETVKITLDSNGGDLIESVLWVLKDEYLIDYLPTPRILITCNLRDGLQKRVFW